MEQFVIVPISIYDSNTTKPTVVTKNELPTYRSQEKPTYQIESVRKDISKDLLLKLILSLIKFYLHLAQTFRPATFKSWMEETLEFLWQILLRHWNVKTWRLQIFFLLYLMLLILHPAWFWKKCRKKKREEAGFLSRYEKQSFQMFYSEGFAVFGSIKNLTKASKLPVSKMKYLLHLKSSYTSFNQTNRKSRRMRAFSSFENEIWCMNLEFVDKLAKDNNGVKFLLVPQDMFDRTVDANWIKTKNSEETVKFFCKIFARKNRPKENWVDQGTEFAGDFKKFCVAEGIHVYSTMSETKATVAERTIKTLKKSYTVIWRNIYTNILKNFLSLSRYWIREKLAR